ncbi:hypothetical protein XA68_10434 [Ophiocordyceps unilateralis]|uniref:Uncharacterized protein n=1 Tax=Ophiocordyceps unilateralis TaxID=268505 RepID=A0A2A9PR19_OPHUN|nr:hypothetical protein XA68_10434 [Ophiocordyceps unilateralis]
MRLYTSIIAIIAAASATAAIPHDARTAQLARRAEFADPGFVNSQLVKWGRRKMNASPFQLSRKKKDRWEEEPIKKKSTPGPASVEETEEKNAKGESEKPTVIGEVSVNETMSNTEMSANRPTMTPNTEVDGDLATKNTTDMTGLDMNRITGDGQRAASDKEENITVVTNQADMGTEEIAEDRDDETQDLVRIWAEGTDPTAIEANGEEYRENTTDDLASNATNYSEDSLEGALSDTESSDAQANSSKEAYESILEAIDDVDDWTERATENIEAWAETVAQRATAWTDEAGIDSDDGNKTTADGAESVLAKAAEDTADWFTTVSRDTKDWFVSVAHDTREWFESTFQTVMDWFTGKEGRV